MRSLQLLFGLFAVLLGAFATQTIVEWDNGSLQINGERIIVMSGEFHYARLPVPEVKSHLQLKYHVTPIRIHSSNIT